MTMALAGMISAVVVGVITVILAVAWARRSSRDSHEQDARTRESLAQFREEVSRELGRLNSSLVTGVASSGQMVTQAQQGMATQLQGSQEILKRLNEQVGAMMESSREMSQGAQTLQTILGGAKTRGILGEVALEKMLSDALAKGSYERQYRFASGDVVDTVVRMGDHLLPVDSKFPLESYRRMAAGGDGARREFIQAVRKHADAIAQKYIRPQDGTLDFALMFVPSEGVYYELIACEDGQIGALNDYCRGRKVFPVSPNTFYACLTAIMMGQKGMKLEEGTRHLLALIGGLQKDLESFENCYTKIGTHLRNARQNYEDSEIRLAQVRRTVDRVAGVSEVSGESERELLAAGSGE